MSAILNTYKSASTLRAEKFAELLKSVRAAKLQESQDLESFQEHQKAVKDLEDARTIADDDSVTLDKNGSRIQYNAEQLAFVRTGSSGESAVLIGAAGTGKTTCMRGTLDTLIQSGRVGILNAEDHKYLRSETPGIVIISFTRRAVANIRKNLSGDLKDNCLTYHSLMEYEPEYFTVLDPETGEDRNTMRFSATRNSLRPLPSSIRCCVIEEASMFSLEFFNELKTALPSNCQYIFLGDIQQLPPVFGSAILGYKMLELPTTELLQVYRQAMESPIIRLAHRILSGVPISQKEYPEWKFEGKLTLHPWKKKLHTDVALLTAAKFFTTAIDSGIYTPEDDMILLPFNKAFGTIELNKHIANHLAKKRGALVYEVVAGFNKIYLSVGDKVLYDKEDATIVHIKSNINYSGAKPQEPSIHLDYWGCNQDLSASNKSLVDESDADLDFLLEQSISASQDSEDRVRQASHVITVRMADTEKEVPLDGAADLNGLLLSYALTVHKSQGSEFRKVFLVLHQSHATMLQRELLYTAVTRAKEELYVICEPESFTNGINSQRIKGNTLLEKAEYFKGKIAAQ